MAARKKTRTAPSRALMSEAIAQSLLGMRSGRGGPFGAVVARGDEIIGRGNNRVLCDSDPTAHAEVVAIRDACKTLGAFGLDGCVLYTSCEPCPMCLGAAYWARVDGIVYANSRRDAAAIGFGDAFIYREMALPPGRRGLPMTRFMGREASRAFLEWDRKADKMPYGPEVPRSAARKAKPLSSGRRSGGKGKNPARKMS